MIYVNLDSMIEPEKERLTPMKYLKDVHIGPQEFQTTEFNTFLTDAKEY